MVLLRVVPYNGRCGGDEGSKQEAIDYDQNQSNALNIVRVESNLPYNFASSAIIENLIINGHGQPNTIGILLENVYNCLIRNLTIMNCDVGIKVSTMEGSWAHGNRFEHIRMKNVKTGILFEGASNTSKYFSYTTIDDVRISLDQEDSVGIMVGDGNGFADLHGAFIKATVWMCKATQKGLVVNGSLRYSLVNLEVEQVLADPYGRGSGYGVVVNSGASVRDNQSFLLTALWLRKKNLFGVVYDRQLLVDGGADYDGDITIYSR